MCTIHLAAMVHMIYILTENKTLILLSLFSFITTSLAARCDTKSLPDHSRVLIPLFRSEPTVHLIMNMMLYKITVTTIK